MVRTTYNPNLKERAKELRKAGNLSEVLFWNQVKNKQFLRLDFDRQKIIGNYIVDFYCKDLGIVIEIDGESHSGKIEYDIERDEYLKGLGLKVIHILDIDIKRNLNGVIEFLRGEFKNTPSLQDTPLKEGNNSPSLKGCQPKVDGVVYQGGGFFKYYELEQYEETLANCKYEDGDLFSSSLVKGWQSEGLTGYSKTPYQEYIFMKDEKMLKALEIDYKNDKVKVDLSKLYPNIDIAETLSNLTGKWIKKINTLSANADTPLQEGNCEVEFEDGTKIDVENLDYKLIKPLI